LETTLLFALADAEIEAHVAEFNTFFRATHWTLDDMQVYSRPFEPALSLVRRLAYNDTMTDAEIARIMRQAGSHFRAIDDAIETADAANAC
jgi:hypothetical protein